MGTIVSEKLATAF